MLPDFIGHAYGPDSAELRSGLAETDRQIGRILALLDHERLDPDGKLVTHYGVENSQFFVDRRRLAERGMTLEQVRDAVQALPFVFAAFTEDEVRRAVAEASVQRVPARPLERAEPTGVGLR